MKICNFEDPRLSQIQTLIFDMGGTLYCPSIDHATLRIYFLERAGLIQHGEFTHSEIKESLIQPDNWLTEYMIEENVGPRWEPDFKIWFEYEKRVFHELGIREDPSEFVQLRQTRLFDALDYFGHSITDDCIDVLDELKQRGYRIGLASNRFGDPIPHLERSCILKYFDAIEYTQAPGYKKPSPYMLLKVADDLQINPMSCAYVGDNVKVDVTAALRADMSPILITQCSATKRTKIPREVIRVETLTELLDVFR